MVVHSIIPATGETKAIGLGIQVSPGKVSKIPFQTNNPNTRAVGMFEVIECLPRMHGALGLQIIMITIIMEDFSVNIY
jgi:hypothetical protein